MAKKPVKRSAKKPMNNRKPTVRNSVKAPTKRRPLQALMPERDEDMLSEFSDDTNTFYTDERVERRRRAKEASAAKKQSKKAAKRRPMSPTKRRLIRVLSYAAIIGVVLIVGVILSLTVLFKTQVYEVTGNTRYAEDEIISACGIAKGENIFLAPKRSAEKRITAAFPYVEEVKVSFKIPDTIRIGIVEATEGYLVKSGAADYLVISTKGRILNQVTDISGYELPVFLGPNPVSGAVGDYVSYEDEKVVQMIDSITQTFADNGYQGITEIDASNTADISFTYDDRIKVKLGIPEDLSYKIRTAMTIINENLDKNQTGATKGILDVSRCNATKRSYFNEQEIHPTERPSEVATEAETGADSWDGSWDDGGSGDDSGYDWSYDYYDENGYGYFY